MSTRTRGFGGLSPQARHEMGMKGARALHDAGKAHQWTPEEAVTHSRKGVEVRRINRARRQALKTDPPPFKYPESV